MIGQERLPFNLCPFVALPKIERLQQRSTAHAMGGFVTEITVNIRRIWQGTFIADFIEVSLQQRQLFCRVSQNNLQQHFTENHSWVETNPFYSVNMGIRCLVFLVFCRKDKSNPLVDKNGNFVRTCLATPQVFVRSKVSTFLQKVYILKIDIIHEISTTENWYPLAESLAGVVNP